MAMSSRSGSTSDPAAAWLLRNGAVLAAVEDRRTRRPRSIDGAVVIRSPALVQTLTSALALDVAWCACATGEGTGDKSPAACFQVRRTTSMAPRRVGVPLLHGALVLAPPGAFERWHLQVGDLLEVHRG
jgi:hypothetical protein